MRGLNSGKDYPLKILILILGLGIIVLSLVLRSIFPSTVAWMPEGFSTPIIAYEFLLSSEEVLKFFGPAGPLRDSWVESMVTGHKVDTVYLLVYGLFLVSWGWLALKKSGRNFYFAIILLAVMASVCDWFENKQLVQMATALETQDFDKPLKLLLLFTWLKWGSLALALGGLSAYLWAKGWLGKIYSLVSVLTIVLGFMAFLNRSIINTYFTLGITVLFLLLIVLAVWQIWSGESKK